MMETRGNSRGTIRPLKRLCSLYVSSSKLPSTRPIRIPGEITADKLRLLAAAALNEPDKATFYGGGAEGYTDYPFLSD